MVEPHGAEAAWLRIKEPANRLILQGDAAARIAAAAVWGVPFSEQACRACRVGERATLWLGPDEHLLYETSRRNPPPLEELESALHAHPHSLVDVSHRQSALEVSGAHAAVILNGACPLDLDLEAFPVGMCTRTVLAKAEILLWRTDPDVFHLEAGRSFQGYTLALLRELAIGLPLQQPPA
jgi:sarcosine oxidase subunit gamma